MKKILIILMLLVSLVLIAEITTDGELPRVKRNQYVQVGFLPQLYDESDTLRVSPLTVLAGADTLLTIPDQAAELIVNSAGVEIYYEDANGYKFYFDEPWTFPCSGLDTMRLGTAANATISFGFIMLKKE